MEAAHASRNSSVNESTWEIIPGYSSRSMSGGVSLFPVNSANFSVGQGPKIEYVQSANQFSSEHLLISLLDRYDFFNFNNDSTGNVTIDIYLGTTLNFLPSRPLKYAIQIDQDPTQLIQPVPLAAVAGNDPADWSTVRFSLTSSRLFLYSESGSGS